MFTNYVAKKAETRTLFCMRIIGKKGLYSHFVCSLDEIEVIILDYVCYNLRFNPPPIPDTII